jgi:hypothetical protein
MKWAAGTTGIGWEVRSMPNSLQVAWMCGKRSSRKPFGRCEEDAVVAGALHLGVDRPGHHVPRPQRGHRVVLLHERLAGAQPQHPALAPERLADQEALRVRVVQARRVELEELHVRDARPGPVGHRHPVAGADVRVAGVQVDLARPARGQHGHLAQEGLDAAVAAQHVGAQAAVGVRAADLALGDQVDRHREGEEGDVWLLAAGPQQGALDLTAGEVRGVGDPAVGVAPLARQIEAVAAAGELHADLDQLADALGPLVDADLDRLAAAQAGPRGQGVVQVRLERVVGAEHRGDPTLGVVGRALVRGLLGQHRDAAEAGGLEREHQA